MRYEAINLDPQALDRRSKRRFSKLEMDQVLKVFQILLRWSAEDRVTP